MESPLEPREILVIIYPKDIVQGIKKSFCSIFFIFGPIAISTIEFSFIKHESANFGEERAARIYPLREFLDSGIPAVISSDAFVQSYNPLDTIRGAVERISLGGKDMGKAQRITMAEAICCHTYNAALSFFQEAEVGSLEVGKRADVVLLSGDLLATEPEALQDVKVELTMLEGDIVHRR